MGIFDKLTGGKSMQLTPKSALVAAAITVVASDGVLDDQELFDLQKIVRGDKTAVDIAMKVLQEAKLPEVMDAVAGILNEKQRLTAMAILLDLAMADGILAGNEQKILQAYMEKFGISETALKPVIDTIALKNDFSVFS
ncbi:MAG: tellurite resistance TerB family protein [Methanoregulaceae archaeon]|nr:tellurite resistance TerB family protein [Methanoregulaceae archaeon]